MRVCVYVCTCACAVSSHWLKLSQPAVHRGGPFSVAIAMAWLPPPDLPRAPQAGDQQRASVAPTPYSPRAPQPRDQRRLANDGFAYTYDEFTSYYGATGNARWQAASVMQMPDPQQQQPLQPPNRADPLPGRVLSGASPGDVDRHTSSPGEARGQRLAEATYAGNPWGAVLPPRPTRTRSDSTEAVLGRPPPAVRTDSREDWPKRTQTRAAAKGTTATMPGEAPMEQGETPATLVPPPLPPHSPPPAVIAPGSGRPRGRPSADSRQ